MVFAIAATLCAAGLVLYYQHRTLSALDAQTSVIVRQIAEQTAKDIAVEARRTLDGPVFETLTAVNHPELRAGRLDLVAAEFAKGLIAYPHVERFFVWTAETESVAPAEALFQSRERRGTVALSRPGATKWERDPSLGRAIMQLAREHAAEQNIYVASDSVGPGRLQALLRLFWTDARRLEYFAVLGFVIEPATGGRRLFDALHERSVRALLSDRGGDAPLQWRVVDEERGIVYGDAVTLPEVAAVPIQMLFYPAERIDSRLSSAVAARNWLIEVAAGPHERLIGVRQYWPTVLSVLLMLVALGLTLVANRRAADLTRMQADFIAHVSHQLKTPLSLLSAATETVAMDRAKSPEKLAQYLGIIRSEVARLSSLVQRILEYSRLQERRGYEFELVELKPLVHETVAAFAHSLSGQQFEFRVEEHGAPPQISADPAAIEQALVNLLDNAVKYSGAARQVLVRLGSSAGYATIEVVDRGIGIGLQDRRRIFDRFYRGSGASVHREGFGLGLSIVQELVHAHGGRVEVESETGHGSTFTLVLPLTTAARSEGALVDGSQSEAIS
jgi:signal transduction histidine kinase